ncbi:2-oxo acid dehydrogenase subunit E2 [Streptosporangium lutulentum]
MSAVAESTIPQAPVPGNPVLGTGASGAGASDIEPVVTDPARAAMEELGVSHDQVTALGLRVVRRSDVEALASHRSGAPAVSRAEAPARRGPRTPDADDTAGTHRLSRVQRAVARAVTTSHDTIPAAYTVMKFEVGPLLERARGLTREVRRPVGLVELFVQAVAGLHPRFPLFFASIDGDEARRGGAVHRRHVRHGRGSLRTGRP